MQLAWPDVVIAFVMALIGGFLGAAFKLNKEAEVRNRAGDFLALFVVDKLRKLMMSRVPSAFNYSSDNTTKPQTRLLVNDTNEKIYLFHSQLVEAAAKCSSKFRKDLYLIAARMQILNPIHIVQLMIANASKADELPIGGLREYLTGQRLSSESDAHLEVARFLVFIDKIRKNMNKHHFKVENLDVYYLTRLAETEDTTIRRTIRDMVSRTSETIHQEHDDLDN